MKLIDRLISVVKTPQIEFLCLPEDKDVIPVPYPARKLMPDWYRDLPPKIGNEEKLNNSTIKRCAPFLDAMTIGFIIPLAADVEIVTSADASSVDYKWNFPRAMIENHSAAQLNSETGVKHPSNPKPPMKFISQWFIKMPAGYGALFVPPLNRPDPRFSCIAGLVDAGYMGGGDAMESVNFPFTFNLPNWTGILKAGTPLVQLIPIKYDDVSLQRKAPVRELNESETKLITRTRARRNSHESYYRDSIWRRK